MMTASPSLLRFDPIYILQVTATYGKDHKYILQDLVAICKPCLLSSNPWDHQKLYFLLLFAGIGPPEISEHLIEMNSSNNWSTFFQTNEYSCLVENHLQFLIQPRQFVLACLNVFFIL